MLDELNSLNKNNIWILVESFKNVKVLDFSWHFKMKEEIKYVKLVRYKARLVAKVLHKENTLILIKISLLFLTLSPL